MVQHYRVLNPHFADRVRESFAAQGAMAHFGAEIARVEPGRCDIRLRFRRELSQQDGYFHGGIVGAIADSAGGYAGYTLMPAGSAVLTVEYKLNLLAPADGDELLAQGEVLKAGRTLTVSRCEVFVHKDGHAIRCATMQQTLIALHERHHKPQPTQETTT